MPQSRGAGDPMGSSLKGTVAYVKVTSLEGQDPPGARMSHPDVDDPQDTSNQDTRNQEADQEMLFLFFP